MTEDRDEDRDEPPPVTDEQIRKELPTLELEIAQLRAKVAHVEARVAWLERGVQGWARGRNWRGSDVAK
jgi:hypothetical protein